MVAPERIHDPTVLALREYDKGHLYVEEVLQALGALDPEGAKARLSSYRATLIDQPWKRCPCLLCSELGIDILVFRGNERNRRRGFHNTYVFYHQLQDLLQRQ